MKHRLLDISKQIEYFFLWSILSIRNCKNLYMHSSGILHSLRNSFCAYLNRYVYFKYFFALNNMHSFQILLLWIEFFRSKFKSRKKITGRTSYVVPTLYPFFVWTQITNRHYFNIIWLYTDVIWCNFYFLHFSSIFQKKMEIFIPSL